MTAPVLFGTIRNKQALYVTLPNPTAAQSWLAFYTAAFGDLTKAEREASFLKLYRGLRAINGIRDVVLEAAAILLICSADMWNVIPQVTAVVCRHFRYDIETTT